jgi:adenylate kinase
VRVAFLGPPGAGKGTQARDLAGARAVPHVATGDMLREAVAEATPLGREAKGYMDRGALVPDEVIIAMIAERLRRPDAQSGFLLDGFPRTIPQAEGLERLLKDLGQPLERVIYFDVAEPELLRRLTGRRVCRACGHSFHVVSNPPRRDGVCDVCGGELYQRADDSEATVRNRLRVYREQTAPLLEWYAGKGLLATVQGEGRIEDIGRRVQDALRRHG